MPLVNAKKLRDVKRYHVFYWANDPKKKLYLLNESNIAVKDNGETHYQFGWHRIYRDGRTNIHGIATFDPSILERRVVDLGEFYDWMKKHHPIRYNRENWEASRPKEEQQ